MQYARLGDTGLIVSRLALGSMTFGTIKQGPFASAYKVDALTPIEETIEALEDVVRQGKVRYIGFSNWPAWLAAKAVGVQRSRLEPVQGG
jgi:aryl-alcohol dehydrogenase-like predicted oxidoreductase